MAFSNPTIRVQERPEIIIGIALQSAEFGTRETIPIELAMTPERAAVLLRLLQDLDDRGMLPDAPGPVSQHRRH